jgi:hypothetical protein
MSWRRKCDLELIRELVGVCYWVGALLGGFGAAIGFGATLYLYGANFQRVGRSPRILTMLVVGAIGAILGMISGISRISAWNACSGVGALTVLQPISFKDN